MYFLPESEEEATSEEEPEERVPLTSDHEDCDGGADPMVRIEQPQEGHPEPSAGNHDTDTAAGGDDDSDDPAHPFLEKESKVVVVPKQL